MKLESLKSSKFEAFLPNQITNLDQIIGGQRLAMSRRISGGQETGADTADLTDRGGRSYDGRPGDGTAGDWTSVKWYSCSMSIGTIDEGGGCGPQVDPPYGEPADLWNSVTAEIYHGVI